MTKYDPAFKPPLSYRFKTAIMTDSMFIREMTRLAEKGELEMMRWLGDKNYERQWAFTKFCQDIVLKGTPEALRSVLTLGWGNAWTVAYIGRGWMDNREMIEVAFSFLTAAEKVGVLKNIAWYDLTAEFTAEKRLQIMQYVVALLDQDQKDLCLIDALNNSQEGYVVAAKLLIQNGANLEKALASLEKQPQDLATVLAQAEKQFLQEQAASAEWKKEMKARIDRLKM